MMVPGVLGQCLSSHSSIFNHLAADWPFFPLNGPHKEKSGLLLATGVGIVQGTAGVGDSNEGNKRIQGSEKRRNS